MRAGSRASTGGSAALMLVVGAGLGIATVALVIFGK